jgi:hypothetical protein
MCYSTLFHISQIHPAGYIFLVYIVQRLKADRRTVLRMSINGEIINIKQALLDGWVRTRGKPRRKLSIITASILIIIPLIIRYVFHTH